MLSRSARLPVFLFFFLNDTAPTEISPLSLHAALPICQALLRGRLIRRDGSSLPAEIHVHCLSLSGRRLFFTTWHDRSEEHTSELQSPCNLVCRLLLEKKNRHAVAFELDYASDRHTVTS